MTDQAAKRKPEHTNKFTPNMENFKVSLSYEGLALSKDNENKTIADLKRKYAR